MQRQQIFHKFTPQIKKNAFFLHIFITILKSQGAADTADHPALAVPLNMNKLWKAQSLKMFSFFWSLNENTWFAWKLLEVCTTWWLKNCWTLKMIFSILIRLIDFFDIQK